MARVYVSSTFKDLEECCEKVGREHTFITVFKVIVLATLMVLNAFASVAIAADNNITSVTNVVEIRGPVYSGSDLPAKLVLDENTKYTLKTGDKLDLGSGYNLTAKQVDVNGKKVWLEVDKDGQYVSDQVVDTEGGNNTWTCKLDKIQGEDNVVVLKIHANQVFQGAADNVVQITGSVTTVGNQNPSQSEPVPSATEIITPAYEQIINRPDINGYLDTHSKDAQIVFPPVENMKVGNTSIVNVRISFNNSEDFKNTFVENKTLQANHIKATPYMNVTLSDLQEGSFDIVPLSPDVQPILDPYTIWSWKVTPKKSGEQTLLLNVYYAIDIGYKDTEQQLYMASIPEAFHQTIIVKVNPIYTIFSIMESNWQWIIGSIITLLLGLLTIYVQWKRKSKNKEE